jgi:periplasmic divalent cation tolerance protein
MDNQAIVVLITAPSQEAARRIAHTLLEQKLAACVNLLAGVRSIYWWEGRLVEEDEVLLVVKSRADLFESGLLPAVQAVHPYQTPEVLALPVQAGLPAYLDWIAESTLNQQGGL